MTSDERDAKLLGTLVATQVAVGVSIVSSSRNNEDIRIAIQRLRHEVGKRRREQTEDKDLSTALTMRTTTRSIVASR